MATRFEKLKKQIAETPKMGESPIEDILARELNLYGIYVMQQLEIPPYRADLAYPEKKLIIECDGKEFHSTPEQRLRDAQRTEFLNHQGWHVIRFTGREIFQDVQRVVYKIVQYHFPEFHDKQYFQELEERYKAREFKVKKYISLEKKEQYRDEMWDVYEELNQPVFEEVNSKTMTRISDVLGDRTFGIAKSFGGELI